MGYAKKSDVGLERDILIKGKASILGDSVFGFDGGYVRWIHDKVSISVLQKSIPWVPFSRRVGVAAILVMIYLGHLYDLIFGCLSEIIAPCIISRHQSSVQDSFTIETLHVVCLFM